MRIGGGKKGRMKGKVRDKGKGENKPSAHFVFDKGIFVSDIFRRMLRKNSIERNLKF